VWKWVRKWVVCVRVCVCACVCARVPVCLCLQGLARTCQGVRRAATRRRNVWRVVGRAVIAAMTAVQVWAGSITITLPLAFTLAGYLGTWVAGCLGAELGRREREAERSAMEQQRIQADARRARRAWIGALAAVVRDEVQVGSVLVWFQAVDGGDG
jgi:hypothetical protein